MHQRKGARGASPTRKPRRAAAAAAAAAHHDDDDADAQVQQGPDAGDQVALPAVEPGEVISDDLPVPAVDEGDSTSATTDPVAVVVVKPPPTPEDLGHGVNPNDDGEAAANSVANAIMSVVVFLFVFGIYIRTLFPTIAGGDSGEVTAAACSLAPAHPPGYPLFAMLAHATMTALKDHATPAYAVNLMCACLTAAGAAFLHRAILRMTGNGAVSFAGACLYAFSGVIWQNAVQAEVFALNNFFTCFITFMIIRFCHRKERWVAYWGAFFCGLGLTNQHTLCWFEFPYIATVLIVGRKFLLRPLPFLWMTFLFFFALTPYLLFRWQKYRPQVPKYAWGNFYTWEGFWRHLLRQEYGTFSLAVAGVEEHGQPVSFVVGMWFYIVNATEQLQFLMAPLPVIGIVVCIASVRKKWRGILQGSTLTGGFCIVMTYLFYLGLFHALANLPIRHPLFFGVHTRFFQQPNSLLFVLTAIGLDMCRRYFFPTTPSPSHNDNSNNLQKHGEGGARVIEAQQHHSTGWMPAWFNAPFLVPWVVSVFLVCVTLVANFEQQDQSNNWTMRDLAYAALGPLPHRAIILCSGDMQFNLSLYFWVCKKFRPDITVLSYQLLSYEWYNFDQEKRHPNLTIPGQNHMDWVQGYTLQRFVETNLPTRPVHFYGGNRPGILASITEDNSMNEAQFYGWPHGLTDRILATANGEPDVRQLTADHERAMQYIDGLELANKLPDLNIYTDEWWEDLVVREYWLAHHRFGYAYLTFAQSLDPLVQPYTKELAFALSHAAYRRVYEGMERARRVGRRFPSDWLDTVLQNLGTTLDHYGNVRQTLWMWERFLDAEGNEEHTMATTRSGIVSWCRRMRAIATGQI